MRFDACFYRYTFEEEKDKCFFILTLTGKSGKEILDFDTRVRRIDNELRLAHCHHRELKLQSFL